MTTNVMRSCLASDLVDWLNVRFATDELEFTRDTALFERGRINSIRILEIIAWVERAIGRRIPDREIRMDNFATVNRIIAVFAPEAAHVDR